MTTSIITTQKSNKGFICVKMNGLEEPRPLLPHMELPPGSSIPSKVFLRSLEEAQISGELAADRYSTAGYPTIYVPSESKIYTVKPLGNTFAPYTLNISNGQITSIICNLTQKTFAEAAAISKRRRLSDGSFGVFIPDYYIPKSNQKR